MLLVSSLGMEVWARHGLTMGVDTSKVMSSRMRIVFMSFHKNKCVLFFPITDAECFADDVGKVFGTAISIGECQLSPFGLWGSQKLDVFRMHPVQYIQHVSQWFVNLRSAVVPFRCL